MIKAFYLKLVRESVSNVLHSSEVNASFRRNDTEQNC
jgi:hypothetical protein